MTFSRWMTGVALAAILSVPAAAAQPQDKAEVALRAAMEKETVEGDVKGAIEQYKKLAQNNNKSVAARALVRLGECYEKQGNADARKTYEQVLSKFGDQKEAVAQARARLGALGGQSAPASGIRMRQIDVRADSLFNVSADGRFAGATDGQKGAVFDLTTGAGKIVTRYAENGEEGYVDTGVISRDGKKVAFWHDRGRGKNKSLVVVDVDSKAERTVYESKEDGPWCVPRDWSPDGKYISVQLENAARTGKGTTRYALVPADGGEARILKSIEYVGHPYYRPRILFSPDGRYVAFESFADKEDTQDDIFVVPVGGGPDWAVISNPAQEQLVGWAPDGSILFLSDRTGESGLYRIRTKDGRPFGEAELLRPQMGKISLIGFAASGALYYSQRVSQSAVYVATVDFETGKLLGKPEPASQRFNDATAGLVWSPDGKMSACIHRYTDGRTPTILIRQDGSDEGHELHTDVLVSELRWRSDGKSLLASGTRGRDHGIFRIDLRTGEAGLVWKNPLVLQGFFPSPDGRYVFTQDGWKKGPLVRRDTTTGAEKVILPAADPQAGAYSLSPDGGQLSFIQGQELNTVPAEGGTPQLVVRLDPKSGRVSAGTTWTPDGRYILYVVNSGGNGALWVVPAGGGQPRQTELTLPAGSAFNIHPDGKRLSYTLPGRNWEEYWVLENFLPTAKVASK